MSNERGKGRVHNETLIGFVKSRNVKERFVPESGDYVEERSFIQEDVRYKKSVTNLWNS